MEGEDGEQTKLGFLAVLGRIGGAGDQGRRAGLLRRFGVRNRLDGRLAVLWAGNRDPPLSRTGWMAERADGARATVEDRGRDAGFAQQLGRALDGVTFANGAQVEHHSIP